MLDYIKGLIFMSHDKETRRGHVETDAREFSVENLAVLKTAQNEILWLLDRGYPIINAAAFVGNHYQLSNRQRLAVTRATAPTASLAERMGKEVFACDGQTVSIDVFNLIITLEVALLPARTSIWTRLSPTPAG